MKLKQWFYATVGKQTLSCCLSFNHNYGNAQSPKLRQTFPLVLVHWFSVSSYTNPVFIL